MAMMSRRPRRVALSLAALAAGLAVGWWMGVTLSGRELARLQEEIRRVREEERQSRERVESLHREADRLRRQLGMDANER